MCERRIASYMIDHLDADTDYEIEMPVGTDVLTVTTVDGFLYLWCLVQDDMGLEIRKFRVAGQVVEDGLEYIGTVQMGMSRWAFHIFEVK